MPIDTRYQRALSLAKSGKLEEAQAILKKSQSPEASELLKRVNAAIARRDAAKSEAAENPKPKAKSNRGLKIGISMLALVVIGGLAIYFLWFLPTTAKLDTIFREVMINGVCWDVYREDFSHLSAESFSEACEQETQSALIGMEEEVDYCLEQSESGTLEIQFLECLVDNGFSFSGTWMSTAR